jgi:hypothetical protein
MRIPVVPSEVVTAALTEAGHDSGESPGVRLVRAALGVWESAEVQGAFVALLRSALTSEQAAAMLREFLAEAILRPMATVAGGGDPQSTPFRAALVASHMAGLALTRYVLRFEPVAAATADELAAAVGPAIDRYLTGDITG